MLANQRAQQRVNKIIKTAWSGLVTRIITIVVSLLMVPLALHYLGKEQYGLWVAVSSLIAMLGFMDGGAGNAVINMVAHASGSNKNDLAKIVSTAFFSLLAISLIGCLLFLAVLPFVSWDKVFSITPSTSLTELNYVVLVVGLFFFLSIFASLVGKVQRGLQEGNLDNLWNGIGAVLSLLFVYIAIKENTGLLGFASAFLLGPLLAYLANGIYYFLIARKELCPRIALTDKTVAKNIFAIGGMFFLVQISATIQGQADNVILSNMLGNGAVADYAICMKLFLMFPTIIGLILAPLWPAYREAIANNDVQWVKSIFLKTIRWSLLLSIPCAFILIIFGRKIIALWAGQDVIATTGLLVGCGFWMICSTVGGSMAALLNSLQLIKIQASVSVISGISNLGLTILLIPLVGIEGAVWGSVISWLLCSIPPYVYVLNTYFKRYK